MPSRYASSSRRQHQLSVRLERRYAYLWGLSIFFLGGLGGSFLCSSTLTFRTDELLAGGRSSPLPLFADWQTTTSSGVANSKRKTLRNAIQESKRLDSSTPIVRTKVQPPKKLFDPHELKLPTPIIVMGLMKAGTTSIYGYFQCGLNPRASKLSHYDCKPTANPEKIGMACGKRMRRNLTKFGKPPFDGMASFTLYAELDAQELNGGMTLPQWDYLEPIYTQFPNATWILNLREPTSWLNSVKRWKDLRQRFVDNPFLPELPRGVGQNDSEMLRFYERQAQRIREFAKAHPSISLVEVPIDSPDAGSIMEQAFGVPKACWRNRNANNGTAVWTTT